MINYVLMDIEGTTTPISFVHQVLFPYSQRHLVAYLQDHQEAPAVRACVEEVKKTVRSEAGREIDDAGAAAQLLAWIAADRKHPALKALQGMIWEHGYLSGAYTSELYPDVEPCLKAWRGRGLRLGIYSSGSVQAQKLLFAHTPVGDLTPLLDDYFDTAVGAKREVAAYRRILQQLQRRGEEVLFLSDVAEELDAAALQGVQTIQVVRPGTMATERHATVGDFRGVGVWFRRGDRLRS